MARDNGPVTPDDKRPGVRGASHELDEFDGRMLELDTEEESPFLRGQKRVPVRRGPLPRKAAHRLKWAVLAVIVAVAIIAVGAFFHRYGTHSWRFRLDSSDQIEISGIANVPRGQVLEVFGGDISKNVFSIPLLERKAQLEAIPWIESATVSRLLPNRLKVQIRERTPVAFVQLGSRIALMDTSGIVMDLPAGTAKTYSFPVITGAGEQEPLTTRAARMQLYMALIRELDTGGAGYSRDISEVDLSDPEDVKVTASNAGSEVLVHLGSSRFLDRYRVFISNIQEWRQKYQQIDSVDMRYDRQVIVNPDAAIHAVQDRPAPLPPKPAVKPKRPPRRVKHRR